MIPSAPGKKESFSEESFVRVGKLKSKLTKLNGSFEILFVIEHPEEDLDAQNR